MRAPLGQTSVARLLTARKPPLSIVGMGMSLTFLLASCTGDSITDLLETAEAQSGTLPAVGDLTVALATDSAITVRWTQVDDGFGAPAKYRVRYATPAINYESATDACELVGDQIGGEITCTIEGLEPSSAYDVQLVSTTAQSDSWFSGTGSNVATGETAARPDSTVADDPDDPNGPDDGSNLEDGAVQDLRIYGATGGSLSVRWTQVDDGTGAPARYRVKYSKPSIVYGAAEIGCDLTGDRIGAELSCTITGLESETSYDLQLMSYGSADGDAWADAKQSHVVNASTVSSSPRIGMWISRAEIAALPMSGAAWDNLVSAGKNGCGRVDLSDQEQSTNVCILAKALLFARTQEAQYRTDVIGAIRQIVAAPRYKGRALALGRELGAYVIAADLVNLEEFDPQLDERFRAKLVTLRTTYTSGAARSLVDCHEKRPNNWGAHCGATRAAIAVYLGDAEDLARTAQVFKGYLGDRSSYAGFKYGGPENDLSWQCDRRRPVGINPKGCSRNGLSLDGVLPDDQRRGGSFRSSPPKENYVWEALQGLIAQAVILHRAGYAVWDWEDRALLRAVTWLHDVVGYPAEGDDTWQPHVINRHYSTTFSAATPSKAGKNVGWTDWTH